MSEDHFEAEVLDRLSNQRSTIDHLESIASLHNRRHHAELKEIRTTQLRHGELLEELLERLNSQ